VQEVTFAQPAKTSTQLNLEITEPTLISRPAAVQVAEPAPEPFAAETPKQGHQLMQRIGIQSRPDEHDQERRRKLCSYSVIGKSESEISNLEGVPAYKRKGMALNQTPSPEAPSAAQWEISNENDMNEAAYTRNKRVD
jgi:hypothetical protein